MEVLKVPLDRSQRHKVLSTSCKFTHLKTDRALVKLMANFKALLVRLLRLKALLKKLQALQPKTDKSSASLEEDLKASLERSSVLKT